LQATFSTAAGGPRPAGSRFGKHVFCPEFSRTSVFRLSLDAHFLFFFFSVFFSPPVSFSFAEHTIFPNFSIAAVAFRVFSFVFFGRLRSRSLSLRLQVKSNNNETLIDVLTNI
jgi:hypothetical protein